MMVSKKLKLFKTWIQNIPIKVMFIYTENTFCIINPSDQINFIIEKKKEIS